MVVAAVGYMPGMSLGKNPHCMIPLPNNQSRFEGGMSQDCG
jgi:hypothetical protein